VFVSPACRVKISKWSQTLLWALRVLCGSGGVLWASLVQCGGGGVVQYRVLMIILSRLLGENCDWARVRWFNKGTHLQRILSPLGVRGVGRVGCETHHASWVVGTTVVHRCRTHVSVEWRKLRVQRLYGSLDYPRYLHSVGTPYLGSRRGRFQRVGGGGVAPACRIVIWTRWGLAAQWRTGAVGLGYPYASSGGFAQRGGRDVMGSGV